MSLCHHYMYFLVPLYYTRHLLISFFYILFTLVMCGWRGADKESGTTHHAHIELTQHVALKSKWKLNRSLTISCTPDHPCSSFQDDDVDAGSAFDTLLLLLSL